MKEWLNRIKDSKNGVWILLLLLLGAALLLAPFSENDSLPMTEEEQRISAVLSAIAGAGESRISIYYAQTESAFGSAQKTPRGAVIVSRGADDIAVRLQLQRAAQALLQLPAAAIEIFPMEETE